MSRQTTMLCCQLRGIPWFVENERLTSADLAIIAVTLADVHNEVVNRLHSQNPHWPWAARHQTSNILQGGLLDDAA